MISKKVCQFLTIFLPGGLDDIKDNTNKKRITVIETLNKQNIVSIIECMDTKSFNLECGLSIEI